MYGTSAPMDRRRVSRHGIRSGSGTRELGFCYVSYRWLILGSYRLFPLPRTIFGPRTNPLPRRQLPKSRIDPPHDDSTSTTRDLTISYRTQCATNPADPLSSEPGLAERPLRRTRHRLLLVSPQCVKASLIPSSRSKSKRETSTTYETALDHPSSGLTLARASYT
jgi:hypothetical protein